MSADPEILGPEREARTTDRTLALRRPDVPTSINELAALKGEAIEIVEARAQVLSTLRTAAIRATSPEDWLLFKAPEEQGGQIVGYLQDCGCDRVRDLYGINITNIHAPEKVTGADPGVFHYIVRGDGYCTITRQEIEGVEGGRSSTDDFCKDKTGVALDLAVRKAARANLDGNIVRELAGLASVPLPEIEAAWTGTHKKTERCRLGRGFGSRTERLGGRAESAPDVDAPICPHCGATGAYRPAKGDRKAFYGCPKYQTHADKKWIVDAAKWVADKQKQDQPAAAGGPEATPTRAGATTTSAASEEPPHPAVSRASSSRQRRAPADLNAGDIFNQPRDRDPGQEG